MRGRKPIPTAMKLLHGNPGRRPLPANEPAPAPVVEDIPPPDWLDDEAKAEWLRVAPMLARNGLLTEMDVDALTAYCSAWVRWKKANAEIRRFGMIVKSPNGYPIQSPYLPIANKALLQMRSLMADFGMTPSARTRVQGGDARPTADDPFAEFAHGARRKT